MRSRRGLTAAVIVGLVASTAAVAATVAHDQDQRALDAKRDEARRAADDLHAQLRVTLGGLIGVRGLFASSRRVTEREFRTFSRGLLGDSPLVGTLLVRRVPPRARRSFESEQRARIRPPDGSRPQPTGSTLYPVVAELWRSGYRAGTGIDVAAGGPWRHALEASVADGRPRSTPATRLLDSRRTGFMVFQPIYRNGAAMRSPGQRRAATTGFAVGAYDMDLLGDAVRDARQTDTELQVFDAGNRIYGPPSLHGAVREQVSAAGRTLTLFVSTPAQRSSALPVTIFGGGLLLSGLVGLLLVGYGRRERYAEQVSERLLAQREEAKGELREAVERFARAFSDAATGMAIVAMDGRLLAVNRALCLGSGASEDELLNSTWDELTHPEEAAAQHDRLQALEEGRTSSYTAERRYLHAEEGHRWLRETASLVRDQAGVPQYFIAQLVDVTESKRTAEALRRSEERYRILANHLPQTSVVTYDRDLRATLAAGPALMEAGVESHEVEGRGLEDIVADAELALLEPAFRAPLEGESRSIEYTDASGRSFWLRTLPLRGGDGEVAGGMAVSLDVTDRVRAQRAQRNAEERFLRAFEDSGVGMALAGVRGDHESLLDVNDALCELTGYSREHLLQAGLETIDHPDDAPAARAAVRRLLSGEEDTIQTEQRVVDREGRPIWVLLNTSLVRDDAGTPTHRIVQLQDVSERKRFERRLQHLADHDPLTGLFNRRRFEEELSRELATAGRYEKGGAVLALDLDHFKLVNDSLGHSAGDALITRVGGLLQDRLRESDILARLSGDEFAVTLPQADVSRALAVADDLLETIRSGAVVAGGAVPTGTTASVGIALFGDDVANVTGEELLAEADMAMYEAKEAGRDRRALYAAAGREARIAARRTWVQRIRNALADDRFTLEGQEILSLKGDRRPRYELLLRMIGEDGDLIPPGAFLDAAERFDLIEEIDRWVLSRAVDLLARFEGAGLKASLEVNLSATSIKDPALPDAIAAELRRTGVDPVGLVLETTETAAIVNVERARAFAEAVHDLGCEFALDDFGAGFASFYFLKHLAFDYLKIDGEFIHNLSEDTTNQLLVGALVDIAHGLGKRTIAEFVGDEESLRLLRGLGVDYVQGFHVARPGPIDESRLGRRQTTQS